MKKEKNKLDQFNLKNILLLVFVNFFISIIEIVVKK
jgi:hypothetical protein